MFYETRKVGLSDDSNIASFYRITQLHSNNSRQITRPQNLNMNIYYMYKQALIKIHSNNLLFIQTYNRNKQGRKTQRINSK